MSMETNEIKTVPTPKSKNEMNIDPSTSTFVFNQCENLTINNNCEKVNDISESMNKVMDYLKAKDEAQNRKEEMIFNLADAFVKPLTETLAKAIEKNGNTPTPTEKKTKKSNRRYKK